MSGFAGRVALVTGGTKGIGLAAVKDLLGAGFRVALSARSGPDVEEVAEALAGEGEVLGVVADVRNPEACQSLVAQTVDRFGGLDDLINNAGVGIFAPLHEMSIDDWHAQIDTNLNGVFYLSKAAVPHLKASEDAWIIKAIDDIYRRNDTGMGLSIHGANLSLGGVGTDVALETASRVKSGS